MLVMLEVSMVAEWNWDLVADWPLVEEILRQYGRVAYVSDHGMMVLAFPDGEHCVVTIPRESIRLFRRLAAMQWIEQKSLRRGRS